MSRGSTGTRCLVILSGRLIYGEASSPDRIVFPHHAGYLHYTQLAASPGFGSPQTFHCNPSDQHGHDQHGHSHARPPPAARRTPETSNQLATRKSPPQTRTESPPHATHTHPPEARRTQRTPARRHHAGRHSIERGRRHRDTDHPTPGASDHTASRGSAAEPEKPHCYQCDRCYIVVETRCIGQKRRKGKGKERKVMSHKRMR